jgi:hypothetical protein
VVIRHIFPLRIKRKEAYAEAFPFEKLAFGVLAPELFEDPAKIGNEIIAGKFRRTGSATTTPAATPSRSFRRSPAQSFRKGIRIFEIPRPLLRCYF